MKEDVMIFTRIEIDQNETRVFKLDPQNVPTYNRQQLYMGIIQATEICILELRNDDYFEKNRKIAENC